jgi:FlaA1/EpsC-like NDP-sugar epimerase
MSRYFMTIPEASWLIVDAAALGSSGDMFILDMGDPIRIIDLARDLVRLAGRDPDTQAIDIVGLRPGEKLHEELFYESEHVEPTAVGKVLRAIAEPPAGDLRERVRTLLAMATGAHEPELRSALLDYTSSENLVAGSGANERPPLHAVPMDIGDGTTPQSISV